MKLTFSSSGLTIIANISPDSSNVFIFWCKAPQYLVTEMVYLQLTTQVFNA